MTKEKYKENKLSIIQSLARLEKLGWGSDKADDTIFPYVIIEAINLLMNSEPTDVLMDYTATGDSAQAMVDDIWSAIACGNGCCFEEPYGFVPEAGCPIHDIPKGIKETGVCLELYNAPCHCNYGSDCCGIFIEVVNGNLVCNECGMGIFELLETQAGRNFKAVDDAGIDYKSAGIQEGRE